MSATAVQFIVDNAGHKTSVIVPFKKWEMLTSQHEKLLNKIRVLTGIADGLDEVKAAKKTGKKLQSLSDFIDESRS
jgi:hypothetical protein